MVETAQVAKTIFDAVDEVNQLLPRDKQLEKSEDTVLLGAAGKLDSLGLINLIVTVEQKIEESFCRTLTLADEAAMSQENNPFATVGSLTRHVAMRLQE